MRESRWHPSVLAASLLLVVVALTPAAAAQVAGESAAVPADVPTLEALGVLAGTRQVLDLPDAVTEDVVAPVVLDGQVVTLRLRPHSVRAPGFQLMVAGADGVPRPQPARPGAIVRGTVEEWPGSIVAGSLREGRLQALVLPCTSGMAPEGYAIEPLDDAPGAHLVHRTADVAPVDMFCGVGDVHASVTGGTVLPGSLGTVPAMTCTVAADTDVEFYERKGSSVDAVTDHIEAVLAGCAALYEESFGVELQVIAIVVRTEEPDPFYSAIGSVLLDQLGNHWASSQTQHDPDLVQLFTGRYFQDFAGLGTLGGVCHETDNVSLVRGMAYQNIALKVRLSAHEFGHNFGANHCEGQPDCGVMCPGLCGPASSFGHASTQSILDTKLTTSCLELAEELTMPQVVSIAPESFPTAAIAGYFTLSGSGLTTVSAVQVGDVLQSGFGVFVLNDTTLHVKAPPATTMGPVPVQVFTAAGRSNFSELVFGPNAPPILNAPWSASSGGSLDWLYGGDVGDTAVLLVSTSNATTTVGGFDVLAGATVVKVGPLNAAALGRHRWLSVSASLVGLPLYSQVVLFDEDGFDAASVVRTTNVLP